MGLASTSIASPQAERGTPTGDAPRSGPPPCAADAAEPTPRLPRGLQLRLTVAIPLTVTFLVMLSGFLALWISYPLFFQTSQPVSAGEVERRVGLAFLVVGGFSLLSLAASVGLAASIARPLRELTSRVASLRPTGGAGSAAGAGAGDDRTEIAALGTALEGVVSSVSSLMLDSYTLRSLEGAVVTVDQAGVVTSFNAVAEKVLGAAAGEAVGSLLTEVVPEGPANAGFLRSLRLALAGMGRPSSAEASVRTRDGRAVQLGYSISPLRDEAGRSLGIVLTFKDLAEQKLAEQLMRRTENLAVLGSIAAGLVHEIRTPLTAMRGFAEMIDDDLPPDSDRRVYTQQIFTAIERMDRLVRDLRTIGNPEPQAVEPQDIGQLARHAVEFCRHGKLAAAEVEIRERYAPDLPRVPADGERVQQVLLNLLRNAFEAVEPGGRVDIHTARRDGSVAVAIHNTGSYIDPEAQEKLFTPFYTTKRSGTGLGLAISHQIVRAHGGRVAVRSDPEAGTTFTVELPLVGPDTATEG